MFRRLAGWDRYVIGDTYSAANEGLSGRIVGDIAAERGQDAFDTLVELVAADDFRTVLWPMPTDNDDESWRLRQEVWDDPRVMLGGSDAGAHLDRMCGSSYTTRLLADCLRGRKLTSVERAVQMMTQAPAELFGLVDRGTIAVGNHADLGGVRPRDVGAENARLVEDLPGGTARLTAGSEGVVRVYVAGVTTVEDGKATGATPGKILRSGVDTVTARSDPTGSPERPRGRPPGRVRPDAGQNAGHDLRHRRPRGAGRRRHRPATCSPRRAPCSTTSSPCAATCTADPSSGSTCPVTQARVLEALDGLPLTVTTGEGQSSIVADLDGGRARADDPAARRHGRPADARGHRPRLRLRGRRRHARLRPRRPHRDARRRRPPAGRPPGRPRRAGPLLLPAGRGGARRRPRRAATRALLDAADGGEAVSWAFADPPVAVDPERADRDPGRADHGVGRRVVRHGHAARAATRRCPTTPTTRSRWRARSCRPCRPGSPAGSTCSRRRWSPWPASGRARRPT